MGRHISKTESISLRRGLSLYKQPKNKGRGSPNWYARVYLPLDGRKIHTKSTGTTDRKIAERFADEFYGECLVRLKVAEGELIPAGPASQAVQRFDKIADQWLDNLKVEAGDDPRRIRHWKDCKSAVMGSKGFVAFFGKDDISGITTDRIRAYIKFRKDKTATTTKRNVVLLNVLLKYAYEKRFLSSVPLMPRVKVKDNPRPWFEHKEYRRLHSAARGKAKAARNAGDDALADEWEELHDFIIFMVGSFLRPSEWPGLKHQHVEMIENGPNPHLKLTIIGGKTGLRQSVTMGTAVAAYKRIIGRSGAPSGGYVFKPAYKNRRTAQARMAEAFEALLADTDLKLDRFGQKRSTYSLRHTALMLRFLKGGNPDILNLARNAGTSVDQLERFYLRRISPLEKIADLQSFK